MAGKVDIDYNDKDNILKQLLWIKERIDELNKRNTFQSDNEDMIEIFTKIFTICKEIPFQTEQDLIKMSQFDELALSLRSAMYEARTQDEYFWSQRLQYPDSLSMIQKRILSQESYDEVKTEGNLLSTIATSKPIENIAYIGSGPLPMGSIQFLIHTPSLKKVINIDCSSEAIEKAKIIAEYNNLYNKMDFIHCEADKLTSEHISNCQVLIIAFMVGPDNQSKKKILAHLYKIMLPGMLILVRTGYGIRQIYFGSIEMADLIENGFQPLSASYSMAKDPMSWTKLIAMK